MWHLMRDQWVGVSVISSKCTPCPLCALCVTHCGLTRCLCRQTSKTDHRWHEMYTETVDGIFHRLVHGSVPNNYTSVSSRPSFFYTSTASMLPILSRGSVRFGVLQRCRRGGGLGGGGSCPDR